MYPWIVMDLGRLNPLAVSLLPDLSDLFLIATLEVASLVRVKQLVSRLADAGLNRTRLHLIVNQTLKHSDLSPTESRQDARCPHPRGLAGVRLRTVGAYAKGQLLNAKTEFRRQIGRLAERVAGLEAKKSK